MVGKDEKPDIRFSKFFGSWEFRKLGDLLSEVKRPIRMKDEEMYQLVTVKRRNEGIVSRGFFKGKHILVKNYFELRSSDYLISKRQVVHGANGIVPEKLNGAIVSNEYLIAIGNQSITSEFLSLISKLPQMYKMFFLSSYGVDIEKLVFDVEDWKKRGILIPSVDEQKKITLFFNKLNNLIIFHQRKYDKLIIVRKSMLEKMFPKDGSSVPEIRFSEFTDAWEQRKYKELAETRRGLTYKPSDIVQDGVRVLRSSNINEDTYLERDDDVFVKESAANIECVDEGDILITSANGSSKLVGKHAIVHKLEKKSVHGGFMLLAKTKTPYFLNASMSSSWYNKFISIYVSGGNGAIGNLNKSDLDEQFVYVPKDEEQIQIGNFFKQLDNLITLHRRKLDKLKNIRKAMLEKMFV